MDLFEATGQFDVVIARLLLQHLSDVPGALRRLGSLVRSGGTLVLVDAFDPMRRFYPTLPLFTTFFDSYRVQEASQGRDRDALSNVERCLCDYSEWNHRHSQVLCIPSTLPGNLEAFKETYFLVIRLLEAGAKLSFDFRAVESEWVRFCGLDRAYAQVGLKVVVLTKA